MDLEILKKKVSTYKGEGGRVSITSDELLMEILIAWELWTGVNKKVQKEFANYLSALGVEMSYF